MTIVVCHRIDDTPQAEPVDDSRMRLSVRDTVLSLWDVVEGAKNLMLWGSLGRRHVGGGPCRTLQDLRALLMYAIEVPSRRRRIRMDVDAQQSGTRAPPIYTDDASALVRVAKMALR